MAVHALLAAENVQTMGVGAFTAYRVAVVACGVVLLALAWWGMGAGAGARVISAGVGVVLLGHGAYLWFFLPAGLVEVYPFLFILPFLVVGYLLYSRAQNKEVDAAVRAQLAAERAERGRAGDTRAETGVADTESGDARSGPDATPTTPPEQTS